jgi:hypothetical protein
LRAWRRKLRRGAGIDEDPFLFSRTVAGRSAYDAAVELPALDPLRTPLQRWIYRIAEQRINRGVIADIARERYVERHPIDAPERGEFTRSALLKRALSDAVRRAAWLDRYMEVGAPLAAQVALLWERRQELARRLKLDSPDAIERACATSETVGSAWLSRTKDSSLEFARPRLDQLLAQTLGADVDAGFPGKLNVRSLGELVNDAGLLDRLDLDAGELPLPFGASSYVRGLARLGAAWSDATAPARQPFVVAHDPYGLRRREHGALFALLTLSDEFLRRKLGLGTGRLRDMKRVLGRIVLLETRAAALRLSLRRPALAGRAAYTRAFEEGVARVFELGLPAERAGIVWQLHADDDQRFCGVLLAARRTEDLVASHDSDWFRNPRAVEQLRAEVDLSPATTTTEAELELGANALWRLLDDAL